MSDGVETIVTAHLWVPNVIGRQRDQRSATTPTFQSAAVARTPPVASLDEQASMSFASQSMVVGLTSQESFAPPAMSSSNLTVSPADVSVIATRQTARSNRSFPLSGAFGSWRPRRFIVDGFTRVLRILKLQGESRFDIPLSQILVLQKHFVEETDAVFCEGYDSRDGKRLTKAQLESLSRAQGASTAVLPTALSGAVGLRIDAGNGRRLLVVCDSSVDTDRLHQALQGLLTTMLEYELFANTAIETSNVAGISASDALEPAARFSKPDAFEYIDRFLRVSGGGNKIDDRSGGPPPAEKEQQQQQQPQDDARITPTEQITIIDPRTGAKTLWSARGSLKNPTLLKLSRAYDSKIRSALANDSNVNLVHCERVTLQRQGAWRPQFMLVEQPPAIKAAGRPATKTRQILVDVASFEARTKWEEWFTARGASVQHAPDEDGIATADGSPAGSLSAKDSEHPAHSGGEATAISQYMMTSFATAESLLQNAVTPSPPRAAPATEPVQFSNREFAEQKADGEISDHHEDHTRSRPSTPPSRWAVLRRSPAKLRDRSKSPLRRASGATLSRRVDEESAPKAAGAGPLRFTLSDPAFVHGPNARLRDPTLQILKLYDTEADPTLNASTPQPRLMPSELDAQPQLTAFAKAAARVHPVAAAQHRVGAAPIVPTPLRPVQRAPNSVEPATAGDAANTFSYCFNGFFSNEDPRSNLSAGKPSSPAGMRSLGSLSREAFLDEAGVVGSTAPVTCQPQPRPLRARLPYGTFSLTAGYMAAADIAAALVPPADAISTSAVALAQPKTGTSEALVVRGALRSLSLLSTPDLGDTEERLPVDEISEFCVICKLDKMLHPRCGKSGRPHRVGALSESIAKARQASKSNTR
jgi:hypothetical protein